MPQDFLTEKSLTSATAPEKGAHHENNCQDAHSGEPLLHLVFGGELEELDQTRFRDPTKLDIVGIFPNFNSAHAAWKAKALATVDNALMRYFIVHLHRFLDPRGLSRQSQD